MTNISLRERYRGCLLGLATGRCPGYNPGIREPRSLSADWRHGRRRPLRAGAGGMDRRHVDGIVPGRKPDGKRGFHPRDQMERYVRWWQEGYMSSNGRCFDIGNTVRQALSRFVETGDPFSGPTDEFSAGNGSLMRLAPVPMYFAGNADEAISRSAESSRTTHGAREAVDACRYFAGLLVGALNGEDKEVLLSPGYCPIVGLWERSPLSEGVGIVAGGSFKDREPPDIQGSGYVVKSLEAALWAFSKSRDFREGALLAVNLGDDADTTGAIYGQVAGASLWMGDPSRQSGGSG